MDGHLDGLAGHGAMRMDRFLCPRVSTLGETVLLNGLNIVLRWSIVGLFVFVCVCVFVGVCESMHVHTGPPAVFTVV